MLTDIYKLFHKHFEIASFEKSKAKLIKVLRCEVLGAPFYRSRVILRQCGDQLTFEVLH